MCGIVGAVALGVEELPWAEGDILMAARTLRHRGPDEQTAWADPSGRCLLGHARLRVIDLDSGGQPMENEDGRVRVVFNGEIYNFRSLREELVSLGHTFRTTSDTEVLVHGYESWGEGMVPRLEGMFAFGLWDSQERRLLLARDRAGKKPLFIYRNGDQLLFASEIKGILALSGTDDSLDPAAFPHFLGFGYVPGPKTFHSRITKLPPAHWVVCDGRGETRQEKYWAPDFRPQPIERGEAVERTRELVTEAVRKRLEADVPLGAFLSGGVDSTIVVGIMAGLLDAPVRTFSIGFADDPTYDETSWARIAAQEFGTEHTEFRVESDSVELIDDLVDAYDEPFGDSSAIPTWTVSKLTREHVTVALSGDGGDELFAGYARFLGMRVAEGLPKSLVALGDALGRRLPHVQNFRHPTRRFSRFFRAAALPAEERWLQWIGFLPDDPWGILRDGVREAAFEELGGEEEARRSFLESFRGPLRGAEGATTLGRALALNFHTYLPEDLLVKADRNSMAHGLELRSPFLDTELIEFTASLPDGIRNPRMRLKGLLKDAFRDLLPPGIERRPKMGFGVPLPVWFRNQWRPLLEELVLASDAKIGEWLRPEPVRALCEEHWSGKRDRGHELWALLTLEKWLRKRNRS